MRQASSRANKSSPFNVNQRLREGALILLVSVAVYLLIALTTYHVNDPGWSHTGSGDIENLAGRTGAWFSDVLFSLFGYVAYLFPIAVVFLGVLVYQGPAKLAFDRITNPWIWSLRFLGLIIAIVAGCGLTTLHFDFKDSILPMSAGGLLG